MNNKLSYDTSEFVILNNVLPEIVYEIRYYSTYNFVGRNIDGYEEDLAIGTKKLAKALKKALKLAKEKGYCLKIYDAYRPQRAVDDFVKWSKDLDDIVMKPFFYKNKSKEDLIKEGYISISSSHSRGSAVDLTLVSLDTLEEIDMGSTFDYFSEISNSSYSELSELQLNNRKLLSSIMEKSGFIPYEKEWWHFILKDEPFKDTFFNFVIKSEVFE